MNNMGFIILLTVAFLFVAFVAICFCGAMALFGDLIYLYIFIPSVIAYICLVAYLLYRFDECPHYDITEFA